MRYKTIRVDWATKLIDLLHDPREEVLRLVALEIGNCANKPVAAISLRKLELVLTTIAYSRLYNNIGIGYQAAILSDVVSALARHIEHKEAKSLFIRIKRFFYK